MGRQSKSAKRLEFPHLIEKTHQEFCQMQNFSRRSIKASIERPERLIKPQPEASENHREGGGSSFPKALSDIVFSLNPDIIMGRRDRRILNKKFEL